MSARRKASSSRVADHMGRETASVDRQGSALLLVREQVESNNSAASQRTRILSHLKEVGSLTNLQARHDLDVMHSGSRIMEGGEIYP